MQEIMAATDIAFPNLGIYWHNVPRFLNIFGFPIAIYGITMALGILAGLLLAVKMASLTKQNPEIYWDFALYAIIFSLIGARLYYVIFSWDMYKDNLLSIFNLRNGGMGFYGSAIGAFVTLFVYTKIKKISPLQMADTGVLGLLIGQIIGRWGNFMNREAFGGYSEGLLAMRLPVEAVRPVDISADLSAHILEGTNYIQVHPTFLYECLWNLILLLGLIFYTQYKKFHGEVCLFYLFGYGVGRYWIEALRTDQLLIPGTQVAISQVIALLLALLATVLMIIARVKLAREPGKRLEPIEFMKKENWRKKTPKEEKIQEEESPKGGYQK